MVAHASPETLLTPALLLAHALQRHRLPCAVTLCGHPPVNLADPPHNHSPLPNPAPRFSLYLRHPVPFADLLRILRTFSVSPHQACFLIAREPLPAAYTEVLHLDDSRALLRIERRFLRHTTHPPQRLVGSISRLPPSPSPSGDQLPRVPWRRILVHRHAEVEGVASSLHPTEKRSNGRPRLTLLSHLRSVLEEGGSIWVAHFDAPNTSHPRYFVAPPVPPKPIYDACKRLFDLLFSLFILALVTPIMLITAVLVKLHDRGPIFFIHQREGLHGKPFGCIKFRTMVRNAEALKAQLLKENKVDGPQFKVDNDPRITPIGRLLRKTNIDELPQFFNVLAGHMSVIGPRPSPFKENQLCPPWREARLSVKPGITGLWQVSRSRHRGPSDFQEWIFFDTQYVERRNWFLDAKILLLTFREVLGRGE